MIIDIFYSLIEILKAIVSIIFFAKGLYAIMLF